jgi:predicted HAD superfamily phosphohydrolase
MPHLRWGPSGIARARMLGAVALIGAFGLGCAGTWWALRERDTGVRVMVTATDAVPAELERLILTNVQRAQVQEAIRRGRDRVLRVVDAFEPEMRTAMDSTDQEIRVLLTDAQRSRLDSARALSGPALTRQRLIKP